MSVSSAVRSVCRFIARFHHWWQLKLLIVEIVGFLTSVSFSMTRNFLLQINPWCAFSVVVSEWTSFRRHSDVKWVVIVCILLPRGYHVCTHVKTNVLIAAVRVGWLALVIVALIHKAHWIIYGGMRFACRMNSTAVQTLVHDFTLMCEFSGIRLLSANLLLLPIFHILLWITMKRKWILTWICWLVPTCDGWGMPCLYSCYWVVASCWYDEGERLRWLRGSNIWGDVVIDIITGLRARSLALIF